MKAHTRTLRSLRRLGGLLVLVGLLGAGVGIAQTPDAPVQLKSISVDRQADGVTVLVTMSGPARYAASFIDSPNRLVVDMQGTTFAWNRTALKSDGDPVREVRGSQFRVGTARVVVELSRKVGYRIDQRPEGLALVLEPGATAQADKPAPRAKETTKAAATIPATTKIAPQKVEPQRVAEAFESLKVDLRPAAPKVEPLVAEATETRMPEVRTPAVRTSEVRTSEVRTKDALVKPVTLAPIALVPVPAQATPTPSPAFPPAPPPPGGGSQRLISLDFKDADVVNLLRILAAESGRNIVAGDDVKGKVSVSLRNVTWEEALDTILETKGLQKLERGSVIRIVSTEQLTKEREALARVQEAQVKSETEIRTKRAEAEVKEAEAATKKLLAEAAISEARARGPLREETIRLSYADPEDVARTLQGILGIPPAGSAPVSPVPIIQSIPAQPTVVPSGGGPPNPALGRLPEPNNPYPPFLPGQPPQVVSVSQDVLAKGITIQAHKPTNSVFIRHYEADLERIKKLIKEQLDVPLPQVKIEARMEILDRNAFEGIGVQWGGAGAGNINNTTTLIGQGFQSAPGKNAGTISPAFAGILLPDGTIAPFNPTSPTNLTPANPNLTLSQLFPISATTGLPLGGNVVNLPFGGLPNASNAGVPAGGIAFGLVSNRFNINLALQALAAQGKTRTLARPEIVTVENNKASVSLGEEIPYATVSSAGTQIQFKEAVLKLEVTPTVLREKVGEQIVAKIKLLVVVENNSRGDTITPAAGVAVPIINRRKAETQVLIREGDRLVIGGVTQGTVSTTVRKVPLLGDIPIFGWLFKQKENNETGRELVVFVTPSILQGQGVAGMALTPIAPR
jgi:type II secretory pathway component HofQ